MAMRVRGQSAKSLRGRDESFSLEGSADDLNEAQRQMGKVTEGTVLDLAFVAVGLTQQKAGVGLALVLADNLGHMQGRGLHSHAVIIDTAPSRPRGAAKILLATNGSRKSAQAAACVEVTSKTNTKLRTSRPGELRDHQARTSKRPPAESRLVFRAARGLRQVSRSRY